MKQRLLVALVLFSALGCNTAPPSPAPAGTPASPNVQSDFGQPAASATERAQTRRSRPHATTSAPGTFDYYLLTLSWSPEYCHSHATAAECAAHSTFVLHGLWPENNNGSYPENCSSAPGPANPAQYADIYPDAGLLQHEWSTHGTCSGLTPDAFFTAARAAFHSIKIPPTLNQLTAQISMTPGQILGLFPQSNAGISTPDLALSCGNNYLTAVEVCLDRSLHPTACQAVKSCRANSVRIPPPQ